MIKTFEFLLSCGLLIATIFDCCKTTSVSTTPEKLEFNGNTTTTTYKNAKFTFISSQTVGVSDSVTYQMPGMAYPVKSSCVIFPPKGEYLYAMLPNGMEIQIDFETKWTMVKTAAKRSKLLFEK